MVGGTRAPVEAARDHRFVVDYGELGVPLVSARAADAFLYVFNENTQGCSGLPFISLQASQ